MRSMVFFLAIGLTRVFLPFSAWALGESTAKASAVSEAESFIKSCFQDYLDNFDKADGGTSAKADFEKIKERCLSSKFRRNWAKLVKAADADPLTYSQDVGEKWRSQIQVKELDLDAGTAKVRLGAGVKAHCLQIKLHRVGSKRLIDSAKLCSKND